MSMACDVVNGQVSTITVFENSAQLGSQLAYEIINLVRAHTGDNVLIGCPGGRSLVPTYRALAQRLAHSPLDMSRVIIVMMDEYAMTERGAFKLCEPDAHYSCRGFSFREIVDPINSVLPSEFQIPRESVWVPDPACPEKYDRRIIEAGGIDIFLLASGSGDGHVAFNPPGSDAASMTRIITLAESTRRDNLRTFPEFRSIADVPQHGVSVGLGTIAHLSKRVVMVLCSEEKRNALARLASWSLFDAQWPASIINNCQNASIYCDKAAFLPGDKHAK